MGITTPTVFSYISLLGELLLVRRLLPFHINIKKRLVKTPKTYIRDSGLVHNLLGIRTLDELLGHPVVGMSWEGQIIETIINHAPYYAKPSFYRTATEVEIDLILEMGTKHGNWAIEIKRSNAPTLSKGFQEAINDIKPKKTFIVYGGTERYPITNDVEVISLTELVKELKNTN